MDHVFHQGEEGVGAWGEVVLNPWRHFGKDLAMHETVFFERAECLGKRLLRRSPSPEDEWRVEVRC